jgi:hypothetical protein
MRLATRPFVAVALVALALLTASATPAGASAAIGPSQHFVGRVNGRHADTVVYTACPGPGGAGRSGPIVGGQTLSVARAAAGTGYTGLFSQVFVWFVQDSSANGPQQVKLVTYGTKKSIPAAVRVPCDGNGQVEFSSCPHLAPCAYGWVPDFVAVKFVNIAV